MKAKWILGIVAALTTAQQTAVAEPERTPPEVSVRQGVMLTTGTRAHTYRVDDRVTLWVAPDTSIRVVRHAARLELGHSRRTLSHVFELVRGSVAATVASQPGERAVFIRAPHGLNTLLSSGRLEVSVGADRVALANRGGSVLFGTDDVWRSLDHKAVHVVAASGEVQTRPYTPPPRWESNRRVWLALDGSASVEGLRWAEVPGAKSYEASLFSVGAGEALQTVSAAEPHLETPFASVLPGDYEVRLTAVDHDGIRSTRSAALGVKVIGARLPDGAYIDEQGVIRLGAEQRIPLQHADGLLVTVNTGHRWRAAPPDLGLFGGGETRVFFRAPEGLVDAVIRLAPWELEVRVFAGPKRARWPQDDVVIDIHRRTWTGTAIPASVQLRPEVTVGIESVDVDWERTALGMRGRLQPRHGSGPWVVRVDVKDQYGRQIGRDFLEVAPSPQESRTAKR